MTLGTQTKAKRQTVYDWPTRAFHLSFVFFFLTAFLIAKNTHDEDPFFSFHMLAGMTLSFAVLLRIVWGFVGTKHAQFAHFALNPRDLVDYFKNIVRGAKPRWSGHNPASSWIAILMMLTALSLGATGYMMVSAQGSDLVEEVHELLANAFLVFVFMHLAGIALHTFRYKELIGMSMLDGKKHSVPEKDVLSNTRPVLGLLFLALVFGFLINLRNHYDMDSRQLKIFGTTLQLGEAKTGDSD